MGARASASQPISYTGSPGNASWRDDMDSAARPVNALTIDVEDYFQVSALAPYISRDRWDSIPCRVEGNIDVVLGLLREVSAKATFFTLGWIAQRYPTLIRQIVA